MRAYRVPCGTALPNYPLHSMIASQAHTHGMVSKLYMFFLEASYKLLPIQDVWCKYLSDMTEGCREICWDTIWNNLKYSSKNLDHHTLQMYSKVISYSQKILFHETYCFLKL